MSDLDIDKAEASFEFDVVDEEIDLTCTITIELDDEANGGKTCFNPGDTFWVKVWSPVTYDILMTGGNTIQKQSNVVEDIPDPDDPQAEEWEYINFSNWQGSASKPIYSITDSQWCFTSLGMLRWNRDYAVLSVPSDPNELGYGVLRIKFKTRYDRWQLKAPQAGHDIKVVAYSTDSQYPDCRGELQVEVREDCAEARPKEITLRIVSCVSGEAVANAYIEFTGPSGSQSGYTDSGGLLYVGLLAPGTYTVTKIEHPDYWPSYNDGVVNDQFVVD